MKKVIKYQQEQNDLVCKIADASPYVTDEYSKSKKDSKDQDNQVPHLSQDTKWETNKITINITNKSQEVSPFPSGDIKAAMNRRASMTIAIHK